MSGLDQDGRRKTFNLWHPRQAVRKLKWEAELLVEFEEISDNRAAFAAFNAASTAWHLVEWTWHTLAELKGYAGSYATEKDFRADCIAQFNGLSLCGQISNGGKHFRLTRTNDPTVSTSTLYKLTFRRGDDGKVDLSQPVGTRPERRLTVSASGKMIEVNRLIAEAIDYWDARLDELGYRRF